MHGSIFSQLQKYVTQKYGADSWQQMLTKAGFASTTVFLTVRSYPDRDLESMIKVAQEMTKLSRDQILKDFGLFIGNYLLQTYSRLIDPKWTALDLIENTEKQIHKVLHAFDPNVMPPELVVRRDSPTQVTITYTSQRRMCALAEGIIETIARHFKEKIVMHQLTCMNKGGASCQIRIMIEKAGI